MRNGQDVLQDDRGFRLFAAAGVAVVALVGFLSLPRTFWEFDELLFAWGILDFDPRNHHPHPPGYPLLVGLGKAINLVAVDPFNALLFLSFLSTVTGFVALCFLFRNVLGESRAAVLGALVFAMSPAMLVNGMLPMSDPPALLFLILALALASTFPESLTNRRALLFGLFCAASIGCRPQYAVPILPMFFFVLGRSRDWPRIQIALATFTVTCLAWLVPLIDAVGGVSALVAFEKKQAAYVATHDASVSRGSPRPLRRASLGAEVARSAHSLAGCDRRNSPHSSASRPCHSGPHSPGDSSRFLPDFHGSGRCREICAAEPDRRRACGRRWLRQPD